MSANAKPAPPEEGLGHAMHAMSHRHMNMGLHMKTTEMRPVRADRISRTHISKVAE